MDYEKKYKEALERAKCLYSQHEVEWRDEDIEYIFPELKKSEDERIRKELITHCRNTRCVTEEGAERIAKWLAWLKKQGEKPADKKEHKFKVGDWIIFAENHNSIYQVERIDNYRYYLRHYLGGSMSVHFDNELIRLWTIQDAKDGDVLSYENEVFIVKKSINLNILYYCCYDGEHFIIDSFYSLTIDDINNIRPATKEQRELLFKEMHEAGYMWDSNSKQLLSLKAEPSGEQKSTEWSEDDEERIKNILSVLDVQVCWDGATLKKINPYQKEIDWLQSLKQRESWKPSEEQIIALRWVLNNIPYNKHKEEISGLLDQIKDL